MASGYSERLPDLSVGVSTVAGMRHLRLGITLVALSIFALLILDFVPGPWVSDEKYVNATVSYVILGSIFYLGIYLLGLPTLEYFGLPRVHFKTVLALLISLLFMLLAVSFPHKAHLAPGMAIRGIIFLFAIGFGEEMVSRGLIFGIMRKFGQGRAIFVSSMFFGLMHLNLYRGPNWDPWRAYWHVIDAFAFGVFACVLMIVTRSIWIAVLFHAISDWSIVFEKVRTDTSTTEQLNPSLWEGLTSGIFNNVMFIGAALLLLRINRGGVPKWIQRVALKWKLVKPEINFAYPL